LPLSLVSLPIPVFAQGSANSEGISLRITSDIVIVRVAEEARLWLALCQSLPHRILRVACFQMLAPMLAPMLPMLEASRERWVMLFPFLPFTATFLSLFSQGVTKVCSARMFS
jgi:hypothetical protein